MGSAPVRVLHLEDDPVDAELIAALLAADGLVCHFDRVATRAEFLAALERDYDLILSDFSLPAFDGATAAVYRHGLLASDILAALQEIAPKAR